MKTMTETAGEKPCYFVLPNLPRDVWYGYAAKPESAQLVAFVEPRHAYMKPGFDAEYIANALNGADSARDLLRKENERLRAALKEERYAVEDDGSLIDEHDL